MQERAAAVPGATKRRRTELEELKIVCLLRLDERDFGPPAPEQAPQMSQPRLKPLKIPLEGRRLRDPSQARIIPAMDAVRLIKYDFEKYGKAAERKRLLDRWQREVESLPR